MPAGVQGESTFGEYVAWGPYPSMVIWRIMRRQSDAIIIRFMLFLYGISCSADHRNNMPFVCVCVLNSSTDELVEDNK